MEFECSEARFVLYKCEDVLYVTDAVKVWTWDKQMPTSAVISTLDEAKEALNQGASSRARVVNLCVCVCARACALSLVAVVWCHAHV